jgi:AcrR family transcriptional regulator
MPRGSEDTRRRIFDAATVEFTAHGIAGARIDRIAAAAGANKQLIYAYFGNKRALFEAVVSEHVTRFIAEVPFDADDLPTYAAAMFDFHVAHPEVAHLGAWHALEPGEEDHRIPVIERAIRSRTRAIERAQARGSIDRTLKAADLLRLVGAIASAWAVATPEREPRRPAGAKTIDARRSPRRFDA